MPKGTETTKGLATTLAKRARFVAPQRVDDLDRDELLWLIKNRASFVVTHRDLLRARWEALQERAAAADKDAARLSQAYAAIDAQPLPGGDKVALSFRKSLRYQEKERAWKAYQKAMRLAERLHAEADAAYKALDAEAPRRL